MLIRISMLLWLCFAASTQAHQMSTAYLNLSLEPESEQNIVGQFQLRWFDLDSQVKLDSNLDGQLMWQEVQAQRNAIIQYVAASLSLSAANQACVLSLDKNLQTDSHFDEGYLSLAFTAQCRPGSLDELSVRYSAMFAQDPEHKLIINVAGTGEQQSGIASQVLTANQQQAEFNLQSSDWLSVVNSYVYQGIVHIFIGTDHILFLVVLVLGSVLIYQNGRWLPKLNNKQVIIDTAWIITAFTLAHSLTLTATALGWIAPSSRWVEVGIAFSIVLTALNNLWPLVTRLGLITFGFGLLHGMGFASVLGELGLSQNHTLLSILAFNIGVEIGQLLILAVVLPLLFICRRQSWYPTWGLKAPSVIIALIALNWTIQRL